ESRLGGPRVDVRGNAVGDLAEDTCVWASDRAPRRLTTADHRSGGSQHDGWFRHARHATPTPAREANMRVFKRGPSEPESSGDFWVWWSEARDRVANAIAAGGFDARLVDDISGAVQRLHPSMAWELGPGKTA